MWVWWLLWGALEILLLGPFRTTSVLNQRRILLTTLEFSWHSVAWTRRMLKTAWLQEHES